MKYHVVVQVNGEELVFIVDADNDVDAQNMVLHDIQASILVKSCTPWLVNTQDQ